LHNFFMYIIMHAAHKLFNLYERIIDESAYTNG
jgi:hypothetical protein